ncbi:hypothetical protein [uncultured Winogradskyella sp.]|uniref:hypothetical protein n=1 Tax=uncultured Winogradskyella sp. TaxID=395353 RepID=UPI00260A2283|nr:hypothetical protein [uncultured Winogradskyella sp.]
MFNLKIILPLLFLSTMVYGQKSTLIQNVNFRAKELKHYLNKAEDSLILEAKRTIYKVNLFNKDYDETIEVKDKKITIPLYDLDIGRYVIEVVLLDKRIIIVLFRNEPLLDPYITEISLGDNDTSDIVEENEKEVAGIDNSKYDEIEIEDRKDDTHFDSKSINDLLNYKRPIIKKTVKKRKERKRKYNYWVYSKVNSGHYSKTIRKMATKKEIDRMIKRNQLDVKTLKGQSNILKIWEVYNSPMFLKHKELDKDFINTKSPYFNAIPFYTTESYGFDAKPQAN